MKTFERVREALRKIASIRDIDGKTIVSVPIMYPSGATAAVEIERNGDNFWVSDMGYGLVEAEMSGAETFYSKIASRIADDFGIGYDGNAMFALWVPSSKLEGAIVCVANASNKASSEAVLRATEAKMRVQNERIFDRIKTVFGERFVARSAEVIGRHAQWEAHNVVVFPNRHRAIFEHMTSHTTSVSTKFLMFSDIKAADLDVSLNAMVRDINALGEKGQMIGDVANIMPISASDTQIMDYAKAS
tara:strand:- start:753 stop:1490 length:738 start_codon:yes stop_codon:yes gene_type:complete